MDYAAKKAFEAKVKKVGKDLGLKSSKKDVPAAFGFGGSSSTSNPFSLDSPEERTGGGWGVFGDNSPVATEVDSARISAYAEMPANYPPLLRLFYVDRSILSNEAKRPVTLIYYVQLLVIVGLVFNLATAIVLTAAGRKRHWTLLLISAFSLLAIGLFQTGIFAQSFRGAYSGCSRSRAAALILMIINGVVVAFYTFAGVCAFNGWARQATAKGQFEVLFRILAGIESLFWTVVLFYSTYSAFEYYTLRKKKVSGLAPAMERPPDVENPAAAPRGSHAPHALSNARAQEIRDKYSGTSGLQ